MTKDSEVPETSVLALDDCWNLLRGVSVGRLAVWVNDHPEIFPINYKVDRGSLVFSAPARAPSSPLRWVSGSPWKPTAQTPTGASPGASW